MKTHRTLFSYMPSLMQRTAETDKLVTSGPPTFAGTRSRHLGLIWTLPMLLCALLAHGQVPFTYTTNHGDVVITGYTGSIQDLVIPDSINGLFVVGIGDSAFANGSFSS